MRPRLLRHLANQLSIRLQFVFYVGLLITGFVPRTVIAAPLLRCQITQSGESQIVDFLPGSDPYSVKAIDINGRFHFKAVVIGDARKITYIKLYIYDHALPQPMLLHEAKYLAPVPSSDDSPAALTGVIDVYSMPMQRNLQYGCALLEIAP
ncbi:hypothetical protein QN360_00590 [Glaciimonas sp. CA11.2]|uniref:hypothetical protein n=1 Tax=Glaciimonas sp. CA11.2 TaxID=3048601 RepID=UPI002AB4F65B|nr:hypothetical protein [Glaciimonas sp. CA11.2]MDY7547677.1 hypothetical protein [Glaciimonas sp. CA11.2]MEB0161406.1 hypothetical protein [Glaciimonas sp. CA11.2]